ncbi:MAG: ABC transporter substrate-binding protein [Sedimenticola sp.]
MKFSIKTALSVSTLALAASMSTTVFAIDQVNVAFFLEWATPNQIAKVEKEYDDAMGVKTNWTNFGNGGAMTEAMLAGDIDISFSQGLTPFANAVNAKAPIKMVGIAVAYGAADDCIIRDDSGITKANAGELEGKTVAVPLNTMADFGFRMTMKAVGVDIKQLKIIDMDPEDGAVALVDGEVTMACAFGENSLSKMKGVGKPMLTTPEKQAAGITSFDIVSVTNKFAQENPDLLRTFLKVTDDANVAFAKDPSKIGVIAKDAEMTVEKTKSQMKGFAFPTVNEQMTDYFSSNGLAESMLTFMGKMFATADNPALKDYSVAIDSSFLK